MLGFRSYLFTFAKYKIRNLHKDEKENDFFQFLELLKCSEGNILDIGANLGIMTVHLAQAFPDATVHAFEPIPDNCHVFKQVIEKYKLKNVVFHEVALGEENGTAEMILPRNRGTKLQGLSHVKHNSITEWNDGEVFEVEMKRLDDMDIGKVCGIKMDVENFEYFVLKGGIELLKRDSPIIYTELWKNGNRTKCFELLEELGYKPHVVQKGHLAVYDQRLSKAQNFIFIHF